MPIDYYTPTEALHKELNILTIEDISKLSTLNLYTDTNITYCRKSSMSFI